MLWAPAARRKGNGEKAGNGRLPGLVQSGGESTIGRAVALLHSFWYEEAVKAFTEVTVTDPSCAMGFWVSHEHVLPALVSTQRGHAEAAWLPSTRDGRRRETPRERDYLAAIETFYRDWDKSDHRSRTVAYEKRWNVYDRYPDDHEAAVFYALA